jgi:Cof subfamily protein (haloacid dehalogenase superfamily)
MQAEKIVLAVDLDGTLVAGDDNIIHPKDVEKLKAGLPFPLVLATGRSLASTRYPFEKNGLLNGKPLPYPLVLNNGGLLYAPYEDPRARFPFPPEVAEVLIRIASGYKDATFLLQGIPEVYQLGETESGLRAIYKYGYKPLKYRPELAGAPLTKLMVLSDRRQDLDAMAAAFAHLPIEGNYSLNDIYELTPRGVNKGSGLKKLLDMLGWQDARLVVAGDGENDACMFSLADLSFAPVTGREAIREMADNVIDPRPNGLLAPILERIW